MSSQSGETLTLALILPRFIMSPLRSVGFVRTDMTSCRKPGSSPRSTSKRVFPSTNFVLPDLWRINFPIRPSCRPFIRQKLFWSGGDSVSFPPSADSFSPFFVSTVALPWPGNVSGSWMRNSCGFVRWKKLAKLSGYLFSPSSILRHVAKRNA